jgi:predicted transcriptional regulator YdeE
MSAQIRIEEFGPVEFIGVALYGNPEKTPFHAAWDLFGAVADDAGLSRIGKDLYGLQIYHPDFPRRFELTYLACIRREPGMDTPARMINKTMPRCRYAVRRVEEGLPGVDRALRLLYEEDIPGNGLRVVLPIDFERYLEVVSHDQVPHELELWVPVVEA